MKLTVLAMMLAVGSGCSAAQSALGALASKPPQATVVNNVVVQAPAPTPAPAKAEPAHASGLAAMVSGGLAGAVAGGVAAAALHGNAVTLASGVLGGAGVGTAIGFAVHEAAD